jgi:O-antigen/teichoic acid export membrane protein
MSLLRKTFVLGLGAGAARLLGAAILVLLARVLGVERFGIFGYAMSVALLLEVVIDMGQSVNVARLVARDERSGSAFGELALNKLALTAVGALAAGLFVRLAGTSA